MYFLFTSNWLPPVRHPVPETEEEYRNTEIREIASGARGFAYTYGESSVHFFERLTSHSYSKRNVFNVPPPELAEREPGINCIQCLSMNDSGDYIIVTTNYSQIYTTFLWGPNITQQPEIEFSVLGESLHHGEINGLSTCRWKPLFMTCGKVDRTVRMWNFDDYRLILSVQYQEDIYCVALHPTGLYATIGFSHKIRYVKVRIDDLETMRAFPIRSCVECAFSNNGHLFAAVNGNIIQIYSCITFQNVYTLKGHNGKIRSLAWVESDDKLVSCGTEGAVYEWYVPSTRRVGETIIKSCVFSGITVLSYGGTLFAVGSDGKLRAISDSEVINEVDVCEEPLDCITITHENLFLFISASSGTIYSYSLPLSESPHPRKQAIHNHPITRMCISENNELLITCSTDGMLCLWVVGQPRRKKSVPKLCTPYFDYILVNKGNLEELTNSIAELNQRIGVLEKEYDYQTQQNEARFTEELKEIINQYQECMETMREQSERLATDHAQELMSFKDDIAKKKHHYELEVQNFELNYEAKVIEKYNKYQVQEDKMARTKTKYEKQIAEILEEQKQTIAEIQQKYELKLHNKELQIDDLLRETQERVQEHESIVTQLEDEVDVDVFHIKDHFENLLEDEKIASAELRKEIVATKNKFKSVEKDVDEYRCQIQKMQNEQKTFKEMIELYEKDIVDIKTEIAERDISLTEKEKQLYTLTRDKQELEKINGILNYGIEELKNDVPTKDNEIKARMEQIRIGEVELEELQKTTIVLEQQIDELKEKLHIRTCELETVLSSNKTSKALLQQFQKDLHDCSGLVQYPKELRYAVKSMSNKYGCDTDFLSVYEQDVNAKKEIRRQTEYLKQTISTLHAQAFRSHSGKHGSVAKFLEQNREIIAEINKLRRELKEAEHYKADLEKVIGAGGKFVPPAKAKARLQRALKKNEDLHNEYRRQLQEKDKIILQMQEDVQRLVKTLSKNQSTVDAIKEETEQ